MSSPPGELSSAGSKGFLFFFKDLFMTGDSSEKRLDPQDKRR
jgi:hypothetical protein